MFDSNSNEQNFSPGAGDYYGPENRSQGGFSGAGEGIAGIMKLIPIIIIVIILAVGGIIAFSYFSSQKDIVINLVDSDNNPVDGKITLKDTDQKVIATEPKTTSSSFNAKLFPGNYRITASGTGYKTTLSSITITNETTSLDLNMTKDLKAAISVDFVATEIYEGQSISGKLSITNSGPEFKTTDIVSTSSSPLDIKLIYTGDETITNPGSFYLDFNAGIKTGSNLKEIKSATLAFKIKGSEITSNKITISALPAVATKDVTISGTVNNTSLTAGTEATFQISIRNSNKTIPMKDIILE
ncbi:MAG: carboxypeptidase-like regulatory domain-containing protein, partial [archaeon]